MATRNRREFLGDAAKLSAAAALAPIVMSGCASDSDSSSGDDNFVASGDVSQNGVVLWAYPRESGNVTFDVATDASFTNIVSSTVGTTAAANVPAKVSVGSLTAATQYYYRASSTNRSGQGSFRTPANLGTFAGLRFGASGDARGEKAPFPSIKNAANRDLDFFVFIGDTIYADSPSPVLQSSAPSTLDEYRLKHEENLTMRHGLNTQAVLRASTASFATIDDHEVNDNFSGGAHPSTDARFTFTTEDFINETTLYGIGLQAFQEYHPVADEFWPNTTTDPRIDGKRRLYRYRTFGSDAALIVLDGRSFRDAPVPEVTDLGSAAAVQAFIVSTFAPGRTMLGSLQFGQLINDLATAQLSGITWKFVVVPEPIANLSPLEAQDRFEGYGVERNTLLGAIQFGVPMTVGHIENVVFVSADIHGSLNNRLEFLDQTFTANQVDGAFEVVTGAIASGALGPRAIEAASVLLSPNQIAGYNSLGSLDAKDLFFANFVNGVLTQVGSPLLGLDNQTSVDVTLHSGLYTRAHSYGWTEFEINATTQVLTVTSWGIPLYEIGGEVPAVGLDPQILTQYSVNPE